MALHPVRIALYALLLAFSIVLLGLTGSRIHYTRGFPRVDPLSPGHGSFYDPIVAELLVTSCLAILWSIWLIHTISRRFERGGFMTSYLSELVGLFTLFVMFLVGAAIASHKWHSLGFCRGTFRACRILTALVAFSWITWATTFFLLLVSLFSSRSRVTDPLHGRTTRTTAMAPETRAVDTGDSRPVSAA